MTFNVYLISHLYVLLEYTLNRAIFLLFLSIKTADPLDESRGDAEFECESHFNLAQAHSPTGFGATRHDTARYDTLLHVLDLVSV